jgi:hypothetical protein
MVQKPAEAMGSMAPILPTMCDKNPGGGQALPMDDLESSDTGDATGVPLDADDTLPEDDGALDRDPEYEELAASGANDDEADAWRAGLSWARLSVTLGLGVAGVQALYMIFTFAQGLSIRRTGAGSLQGDFFHRIGIAFSRSLSPIQGLALVVAVALVSLPSMVDIPLTSRYERRRIITLWAVGVIAIIIGIGNALGIRAELHLDQLQAQAQQGAGTTPFRRWSLATDVVGTLGMALLAFLAALAAFPERRRQPVAPEPLSEPEPETAPEEPRS